MNYIMVLLFTCILCVFRISLGTHPYSKLLRRHMDGNIKDPVSSLKNYEIVHMKIRKRGDVVYVDFKAFHETFAIILRPMEQTIYKDILPKNIHIVIPSQEHSSERLVNISSSRYYLGFSSKTRHEVHGYFRKSENFDGVIHFSNKTDVIYIEPAVLYFNSTQNQDKALVYKASDYSISENIQEIDERTLFSVPNNYERLQANLARHRRSSNITSNEGQHCTVSVFVDHLFFTGSSESDHETALEEVLFLLVESNKVFRSTDLLDEKRPSNIGFAMVEFTVLNSERSNEWLNHEITKSYTLLDKFSEKDFSYVCLGILLTHRPLEQDHVGLAWTASPHNSLGGICGTRQNMLSTNTLLITTRSMHGLQPHLQVVITTLHELGHAFGAHHDEVGNAMCTPGGSDGNYIMAELLTDKLKRNTLVFSLCSLEQMQELVQARQTCFQRDIPHCGNGRIEDGEECDCGSSAQCDFIDPTCTPAEGLAPDQGCTIRRALGKVCSPKASLCCTSEGQVIPASAQQICNTASECGPEVLCNGISSECPVQQNVQNGHVCEDRTGVCLNGVCSHKVCNHHKLDDCACSDTTCELCCLTGTACVPLHHIIGNKPMYHKPRSFCDDEFKYRCNKDHKCFMAGTLDLFSKFKRLIKQHMLLFIVFISLSVIVISLIITLIIRTLKQRSLRQNLQLRRRRCVLRCFQSQT